MRNSILRALVASDLLEEVFQGSWLKYLAWRFRSQRADYYQYLADLIDGTGGTKTLFSIFQDDAQRMRKRNCRGALSQVWLERYPLVGGDLFATWFGSIPLEDLIAIQNAQSTGAQALVSTLRKLSEMCRLLDRAKSMFVQTALVGFVALLVAIGAVMSIPIYTAEHLARVFSAVPVELYGQWTNALQLCATWLRALWLLALLVLLGMVLGVVWSLPNGVGVWRRKLDHFGVWLLYRRLHSIRFLSLLRVLLDRRGSAGTRLRHALTLQARHVSPWLDWHLQRMLQGIDQGCSVIEALDTGLIDSDIWWYFVDMVCTLGLDTALERTGERLASKSLHSIHKQAIFLRWILLFCALAIVLGVLFWHFQVFDELRYALTIHYAH
jgi:type II secretory pathway component PulF